MRNEIESDRAQVDTFVLFLRCCYSYSAYSHTEIHCQMCQTIKVTAYHACVHTCQDRYTIVYTNNRETDFSFSSPQKSHDPYISFQLRNLAFKKIPQKSASTSSCMTLSGIAGDLLNPESRDPNAPSEGWQQWKQRDDQV